MDAAEAAVTAFSVVCLHMVLDHLHERYVFGGPTLLQKESMYVYLSICLSIYLSICLYLSWWLGLWPLQPGRGDSGCRMRARSGRRIAS